MACRRLSAKRPTTGMDIVLPNREYGLVPAGQVMDSGNIPCRRVASLTVSRLPREPIHSPSVRDARKHGEVSTGTLALVPLEEETRSSMIQSPDCPLLATRWAALWTMALATADPGRREGSSWVCGGHSRHDRAKGVMWGGNTGFLRARSDLIPMI